MWMPRRQQSSITVRAAPGNEGPRRKDDRGVQLSGGATVESPAHMPEPTGEVLRFDVSGDVKAKSVSLVNCDLATMCAAPPNRRSQALSVVTGHPVRPIPDQAAQRSGAARHHRDSR